LKKYLKGPKRFKLVLKILRRLKYSIKLFVITLKEQTRFNNFEIKIAGLETGLKWHLKTKIWFNSYEIILSLKTGSVKEQK